jgi:ZIP family zinc transporter
MNAAAVTSDALRRRHGMLVTSIITGVGFALHNFPEGVAVYASSLREGAAGFSLWLAMFAHNLPEGMCVAIPLMIATESRVDTLLYAAASGLCAPVGAVLFHLLMTLSPVDNVAVDFLLSSSLSVCGGIMLCISLVEILPHSLQSITPSQANVAFTAGMVCMKMCQTASSFVHV